MQRQIIAPVGSLDKQRHDEYRHRGHRIPLEGGGAEDQPHRRIYQHEEESGGMSRRLPDIRGPVLFSRFKQHRRPYRILTVGSRPHNRSFPRVPMKPATSFGDASAMQPSSRLPAIPAFSNKGVTAST